MCYPPPGPRCSSHANQEWLKAVAALDKEEDNNKKILLQSKADEALRAFYSTPRGQNRLLREIGALQSSHENQNEITKLSLQLRDGQLTRKNQIAAFNAVKNSKESSIKELLPTTNKQEQAVGIAFHVLMRLLPEEEGDNVHIDKNNLIQLGSAKILCLPQKHQRVLGAYRQEEDGYLSSEEFPPDLLDVLSGFAEPELITPNYLPLLSKWVLDELQSQGIQFLASVDVKTEKVVFDRIENLFEHYSISFTQKKKLGGTSPYIHGETDFLKEILDGTPLSSSKVVVTTIKNQKRTYLLETPIVNVEELHSPYFHFSENKTPEGERFYEVRVKHQSSQFEVLTRLTRKTLVIPRLDITAVKKFILENFTTSAETQ